MHIYLFFQKRSRYDWRKNAAAETKTSVFTTYHVAFPLTGGELGSFERYRLSHPARSLERDSLENIPCVRNKT